MGKNFIHFLTLLSDSIISSFYPEACLYLPLITTISVSEKSLIKSENWAVKPQSLHSTKGTQILCCIFGVTCSQCVQKYFPEQKIDFMAWLLSICIKPGGTNVKADGTECFKNQSNMTWSLWWRAGSWSLLEEILEVTEEQSQTLLIQQSVGQHGSNANC